MASAAVVQPTTPLPGFAATNTCNLSSVIHIDCIGEVTDNGVKTNPNANDSNDSTTALNANGFFGYNSWENSTSLLSLTGMGTSLGTFSFTGMAGYIFTVVVKASNGYNAFLLNGTSASGATWNTAGISNNGGQMPALSHLSLYRAKDLTQVPLPASALLLLAGLGAFGAMRARRKA